MNRDAEAALVERCRVGDRGAFETLIVTYQRPIYNATYRIVGNIEDARDLTQTVFLKAYEGLGSFDPKYKFFSWLYRIAVNESLNHLRRYGREQSLEVDEPEPESLGPEALANQVEVRDQVQMALMRMKVEDRVVLILRHYADCSYCEIAGIIDVPEKTVKSRLFSARQRLRDLLETWQAGRA